MWERTKKFFEEARIEFRHVNWPTRAEAMRLTGVVVGLYIALAIFLGVFDYLFTSGIGYLAQRFVTGG